MILTSIAFLVSVAGSGSGQEQRPDPDAWLNSELRRELAKPPRPLWRQAPDERDLRGNRDLLGDESAMNDVLANDLFESVRRLFGTRVRPEPPPEDKPNR